MANRELLSLTLDEIIKQKNLGRKFPTFNANRTTGLRNGGNFNRNFNSSLTNRLSRRIGGPGRGFISKPDLRTNRNIARLPNIGRFSTPGNERKSIYSRLTHNKPPQKLYNVPREILTKNLKTRNAEDFHPVRINNGAIVKGLRSDQLLLQKINDTKNKFLQAKVEKLRDIQARKSKIIERKERSSWKSPSKVSMDIDHGLTVSIPNEIVSRRKSKSVLQARRYLPSPDSPSASSSTSSSSEEEEDYVPQRASSRRVSTEPAPTKDQLSSILRLGAERPPPPKPHKQVLDQTVQKEIAALQGYDEPHSVGPGPGVKGFKMMPTRTKTSLNERFTIERHAND